MILQVSKLVFLLHRRGQHDSLDVISVRSATTCDPRRSATPRLLKVRFIGIFSHMEVHLVSRAAF